MGLAEERERLVNLAKVASQAGLYNESLFHPNMQLIKLFWVQKDDIHSTSDPSCTELMDEMKKIAKLDVKLTVEEQHLLWAGYINLIRPWRNLWSILSSIKQKEEGEGNKVNAKLIKSYREKVESELETIYSDILALIDEHLIPSSSSEESASFFYTLKGNSYWFLAEFKGDIERKEVVDQSLEFDQNVVLHFLESPEVLKAKVAEATEVLRNVNESSSAVVDDQLDALSLSDDGQ